MKAVPFWQRFRLFQKLATGILFLFLGIMLFVTLTVYSRKSGVTGFNMAEVQKMRDPPRSVE